MTDSVYTPGMATISTLFKVIGLFCKRSLYKKPYSAKETYNLKEPTNRSHSIVICARVFVKFPRHHEEQETMRVKDAHIQYVEENVPYSVCRRIRDLFSMLKNMGHIRTVWGTWETHRVKDAQIAALCYMGWLQLVGSWKLQVSFAMETYKRDDIP